jgi:hypothetical protein
VGICKAGREKQETGIASAHCPSSLSFGLKTTAKDESLPHRE